MLEKLLNQRITNNSIKNDDTAALKLAIRRNNFDMVKCLLKAGANPRSLEGHSSESSLYLACASTLEILTVILNHVGDVRTWNDAGWNLLHQVVSGNIDQAEEKIKLLMDRGASVNQYSQFGGTPMHTAIINKNDKLLEVLLDYGADIEARAWHQRSPLHIAVEYGTDRAMWMLIKRGARLNTRDARGLTPLQIAYLNDLPAKLQILLDFGADVYGKDQCEGYFCQRAIPKSSAERLVKHIAKLKHRGLFVDEVDVRDLKENCFEVYVVYEKCLQELERMSDAIFYQQLTYYDLVNKSDTELVKYARCQMFQEHIGDDVWTRFPVYASEILHKLERVYMLKKEWRSIEVQINPCLSPLLPSLVIEKIAYFTALLNKC